MDFSNALSNVNWLAVFLAALATFFIGGLWYSPLLFAKSWMKENGFRDEELKTGRSPALIFGGSFVLALIASFVLALFIGPEGDARWGATAGALVGIAWVATSIGVLYLFERKSMRLFLINAGYHTVSFIIMGLILGAWH